MEESEKRRERLKAMRMEASQVGGDDKVGTSAESHHLSNPLSETSAIPPLQMNSYTTPRFDYYTDPMAAFSANKRRSKASNQNSKDYFTPPRPRNPETAPYQPHQVQTNYSHDPRMYQARGPSYSSGPRNPEMSPSPAHQPQRTYSPGPRMYQAQGPSYSSGPWNPEMSPILANLPQPNYSPDPRMYQAQGPYHGAGPRHPEMAPSPSHQFQTNYSPEPRVYQARGPNQSPIGMVTPSGPHQGTRGGPPSHYNPSNSSGVGNFPSPGYGSNLSSNSARGRGHWFSNSQSSGSDQGRGRSGSGRGGRRGFGSHDSVSAELRPDLYYNKSMVEDPWKDLEPVIWKIESVSVKGLFTPQSLKSPLPNSSGMKKARIFDASNESSSQPSLAEYLAAAFNEAANDEAGNDKPCL